ncbi:MAG: hypothetical protein NT126_10320 [Bacteroidetes bacterium]|nr:hypothetical protein [Bacteroidota bacterium]
MKPHPFIPAFFFVTLIFFSCSKKIHTVKTIPVVAHDSIRVSALWNELDPTAYHRSGTSNEKYKKYRLFALDSLQMQQLLAHAPSEKNRNIDSLKVILEFPRPDSGFMKFNIYRTSVMDPALEAQYPLMKSYGGQGVENRSASIRFEFNSNGFHAYVISSLGEWFIQPPEKKFTHQFLFCYFKSDFEIQGLPPFELPGSPRK